MDFAAPQKIIDMGDMPLCSLRYIGAASAARIAVHRPHGPSGLRAAEGGSGLALTIAQARRHIEFGMNNIFKKPGVADALYEGLRRCGVPRVTSGGLRAPGESAHPAWATSATLTPFQFAMRAYRIAGMLRRLNPLLARAARGGAGSECQRPTTCAEQSDVPRDDHGRCWGASGRGSGQRGGGTRWNG